MTGDTCQCIAHGVGFRFQDLRSLFHYENQRNPDIGVPEIHTLSTNYRTHSGILKLANSIVDIMAYYFRDTVDVDPKSREVAHFKGPRPLLLTQSSTEELVCLLAGGSASTEEKSTIEFGAHQAIIVRNQQAKETLPAEFQGALCLTTNEAKGLEFDDVILYNFFKDSLAQNQEWRCVTQYQLDLQDEESEAREMLQSMRPLQFNRSEHMALNDELKHLYVGVTRARVRVILYDEDKKMRAPFWHFLTSNCLVEPVSVMSVDPTGEPSRPEMDALAVKSTPEEWRSRGNNLLEN